MKKHSPRPSAGRTAGHPRKHRSRPTPKWLQEASGYDAIARSRCLMLLSVLSGEKPVTDAILEAKISRGTYYQLETRALQAILEAMNPLSASAPSGESLASERIETLEAKLARSEQQCRRSQRLLLLTRKSIRAPVTTGRRGRPPKAPTVPLIPTPPGARSP